MSERLTERLANGGVMFYNGDYWCVCYPWNEDCLRDIDRMAIKLCELEDKIETGKLCEVRHGEWEHEDEYDDEYLCSNCGKLAPLSIGQIHEYTTKYCPNCGAKMDGERSENGT